MAHMEIASRYAIIVGVASYDDDQISSLRYTKNDAIRIADLLIQKGGFDRYRVRVLANGVNEDDKLAVDAVPPTRPNLLQRLQYAVKSAEENDLILLFFAGHGSEVSKSPYLLTADTKMDVLQHTAIKVTEINQLMEESRARCVVRIFDACRSPFGEARGVTGRMTDGLQAAMLKTAAGWASFSSCSSGEIAHESGEFEQGIFTHYLCEGLEGKAANEIGEVSIERLVDYVKTSVGNWSDEQSQRQTPQFQSDLSGQLVLTTLTRVPVPPPPDVDNPLGVLLLGIEKHLSQTPDDTRNLTFTDGKECEQVFRLGESTMRQLVQDFSHPSLTITAGERTSLQELRHAPWQQFCEDIEQKKVKSEFKGQTSVLQIGFTSSEVVVPRTTLTVGLAQFSFFYWLWYLHECDQKQLQGSFTAQPPFTKGFFTFKPNAALDGRKMENTVKEVFKRASEDILRWAEQLGKYVDARLTPLRVIGKIVE